MYKNFPNKQEKKNFFDDPKVFLKGRYIQPKGKSIGEKISHKSGRIVKAGRIGRVVKAVTCHVLKMVYSYFVSLIYVFYFLS